MQGFVWESYCSLSICLNLSRFTLRVSACFAYDKTVINKGRVEKSAFENQSEENLVWVLKWTTLLRIFCKYVLCLLLHLVNSLQVFSVVFNANICNFAGDFFLIFVLLAWIWLSTRASLLLHKCHENITICLLKLVVLDCCLCINQCCH